ncbi:MAG TPA: CopG family transcriptional regulator [Sphingomicrobium sp.]|jgi:Arc/MetJ-type ribon-helix-helix transcriptional regulator
MPAHSKRYTLRIDEEVFMAVEGVADRRGVSPAEVMRDAITAWIRGEKKRDESDQRLRRICEFTQVALDVIIRENHPEERDKIVANTDKRMRLYHGG